MMIIGRGDNTIKNKKIKNELCLTNDKIFTEEVFDEIRKLGKPVYEIIIKRTNV